MKLFEKVYAKRIKSQWKREQKLLASTGYNIKFHIKLNSFQGLRVFVNPTHS